MDYKAMAEREKMQKESKTAIRNAGFNAAIIVTVGGGKGKVLVDLAEELLSKDKIKSVLYLCDSTRLRDSAVEGFPQELEKWASKELKKVVQLECYQTAHRWKDKHFDLVLGDEIDFAITPKYANVFFNNTFKYRILVSGTLSAPKEKILKTIAPIVYRLGTTDAEDRGIINRTTYYLYNFPMTDKESEEYAKWSLAIAKAWAAELRPDQINFLLGKRKELLYGLESSVKQVKEKLFPWLWQRNKRTRLIIFCERTDEADKVCRYSYHGGNEDDDNLTKFQNKEISGLSVVGKIKRGINLKEADTAIFKSLSGNSTTDLEQKNGRMKRLKISELATVIFMVPWYRDLNHPDKTIYKPTIVDEWVHNATSNLKGIEFINLKL